MSTPLEIAATAAGAVVGAMATKAWSHVRERCVALFHQYLDEDAETAALTRLDTHQKTLSVAPVEGRDFLSGHFSEETAKDLEKIVRTSPEAASLVRALEKEARSVAASEGAVIGDVRVENVWSGGDVNVAGRDVTVRRGL